MVKRSKGQENSDAKRREQNANSATGEAETPKALLNDVVLQNIFKYLGYKELKACREVGNITWLRNSKKAWWARTNVKLEVNPGVANNLIEKYINQINVNSNATNYKLDGFKEDYFGFWEHFGHSIKELELWHCSFGSADGFRQIIYSNCPNLEKLVVIQMKLVEESIGVVEPLEWEEPQFEQQNNLKYLKVIVDKLPVSWCEMLSHFPKLQFLEANVKNSDIFKAISIIRQHNPEMLKLKHIDVTELTPGSIYDESICSVFLDPKLSLEKINLNPGKFQSEVLLDILELHAESLRKLTLEGDYFGRSSAVSPRQPLKVLEELRIVRCHFPVDIFKYTPNVTKVALFRYQLTSHNILETIDPNLKLSCCKDFSLDLHEHGRTTPDLEFDFFIRAFPNVEKLSIRGLDNRKFSLICKHFTKLVTFNIDYCEVDAAGLLGFNPDSKDNARIQNPNIASLENLQSFLMRTKSLTKLKNGSDIYKALKRLHHLKTFELWEFQEGEDQILKKILTNDSYA